MEKNNEDIIKQIEDLREGYKVELYDAEEENLSFLDQINGLIGSIFNDSSLSVYTAFSPESLEKWKKKRLWRGFKAFFAKNITKMLYFSLLATITAFLVSEAVDFYAINDVISPKTYVKAILTEICFIFLSGYRSEGKWQMAAVTGLRIGIFCLMLFAITSKTFMDSSKTSSNTSSIQAQVELLEEQIAEKKKSIAYYKSLKRWPTTVKQLIKEKDAMIKTLIILKEKQARGATVKVSELVRYQAYGKAFFRVLLLFISMLITRRTFAF